MSKSLGNVVDPLDVVDQYGADTLRTYVLFMGEYGTAAPWNESSVKGCKRFLERVADLPSKVKGHGETAAITSSLHKTIKKVSSDIEEMKFNTAIAALMGLLNDIDKTESITEEEFSVILRLLCPFAPHLAEELWAGLGKDGLCSLAEWPSYDEAKTIDDVVEIALQICGKFRGTLMIAKDATKDEMLAAAKAEEKIASMLEGKTIVKEIVVPGKLVNIVAK
jgi:leucyl-tRNA synthetase